MYLENAAINDVDSLSLRSECYGSAGELPGEAGRLVPCQYLLTVLARVSENRKITLACLPLFPFPLYIPPPAFFMEEVHSQIVPPFIAELAKSPISAIKLEP